MKIFRSIDEYKEEVTQPAVITVGNFDGVHKGHITLIKKVLEVARSEGRTSTLVTFCPHTRIYLQPESDFRVITFIEEKAVLLENSGLDNLLCLPFNEKIRRLSPEEFVSKILGEGVNATDWVMGLDHTFGKDRVGSNKFLRESMRRNHIRIFPLYLKGAGDITISSSEIRSRISSGDLETAVTMMGHPYLISAQRIEGKKIGRKLGYPTLNFSAELHRKVLPPVGVFAAHLEVGTSKIPGALYFGDCPTFGNRNTHFELHLLSKNADEPQIGEVSNIWVHRFIRGDERFESTEELITHIKKDIETIQQYFAQELLHAAS